MAQISPRGKLITSLPNNPAKLHWDFDISDSFSRNYWTSYCKFLFACARLLSHTFASGCRSEPRRSCADARLCRYALELLHECDDKLFRNPLNAARKAFCVWRFLPKAHLSILCHYLSELRVSGMGKTLSAFSESLANCMYCVHRTFP